MSLWWQKNVRPEDINERAKGTLSEALGIRVTEITDSTLRGKMPVDERTRQPYGLLHGGASCALAETLGSIASNLAIDPGRYAAVGQNISSSHIKSAREGEVYGEIEAIHLGRRSHIWDIRITDGNNRLICTSRLTMAIIEKDPATR